MKIVLKHSTSQLSKEHKLGFSWTTFFFGAWVAVFRGHWGEFAKWVFLNPITLGIWGLIQCWTTNQKAITKLLEKGYVPATRTDAEYLMTKGVLPTSYAHAEI